MYLDWTQLSASDLPAPLDEIARLVGEDVLDRLATLGVDELPDIAKDQLGMAVAWSIAESLGGTVLYVPVLSELERDARNQAIVAAHDSGRVDPGRLARRFDVSRRTIERALKSAHTEPPAGRARATPKPSLPDLFGPTGS